MGFDRDDFENEINSRNEYNKEENTIKENNAGSLNAEDEQRDIEARIEQLENLLKNAEVVVEDEVDLDTIGIGCMVKILDKDFDDELDFKIVGSTEADSLAGKISNESPLGKALLGKRIGETAVVETQAGVSEYMVLEIQRVS